MRTLFGFFAATVLFIALEAAPAWAAEKDQKLDLKEVPEAILEAAQSAVEGIEFKEVELVTKPKYKVYEFEGRVGKKNYEVEVKIGRGGEIVGVRFKVPSVAAVHDACRGHGHTIAAGPSELHLEPYGQIRSLLVRGPHGVFHSFVEAVG